MPRSIMPRGTPIARLRVVLWRLEVVDTGVVDGEDLVAVVATTDGAAVMVTMDCGSESSSVLIERFVRTIGSSTGIPKVF